MRSLAIRTTLDQAVCLPGICTHPQGSVMPGKQCRTRRTFRSSSTWRASPRGWLADSMAAGRPGGRCASWSRISASSGDTTSIVPPPTTAASW